jgi:hypothetical protein
MKCTLVGYALGLGAMLLPFPRLATRDAASQWQSLAADASELFALSVRAFCCTEDGRVDVPRVSAKNLLESCANRYHNQLRFVLEHAEWEGGWFQAQALRALRADLVVLEHLLISIRGMNHALTELHTDVKWHSQFLQHLKGPLTRTNARVHAVFQAISASNRGTLFHCFHSLKSSCSRRYAVTCYVLPGNVTCHAVTSHVSL